METKDIPTKPVSMWQPEADPYVIAVLGKLGEESNELGAKIFRALIQGLYEADPETGKLNIHAISDEVADVEALITNYKQALLNYREREDVLNRAVRKVNFKAPWFAWLKKQSARYANR